MMEDPKISEQANQKVPQARYGYYRRCHVFRRNGEQCKGPAEKGTLICHAHAGQIGLAARRERERQAVLAEAVAEMRRRGRREFKRADLFMDFKGIQAAIAVMARALIGGRIDCKTAGRLAMELQTASKLLWMTEKAERQLTAEARRPRENESQQEAVTALIAPKKAGAFYKNSQNGTGPPVAFEELQAA